MKYRVAVYPHAFMVFGGNLRFEPQVWRWWWPFWVPLCRTVNEGGGTRIDRFSTSEAAWGFIEGFTDKKPKAVITYEYGPPNQTDAQ